MTTILTRICRRGVPGSSLTFVRTASSEQNFEKIDHKSSHTDEKEARKDLIDAAFRTQSFSKIDSLVKYLQQNVILHEPRRFLILPKPYGISCVGMKQKGGGVFKNSVHDQDEEEDELERTRKNKSMPDVTLSDCLPFLSKHFNEPNLEFCVGLKRNLSGPIVLPTSKKDYESLLTSIKLISSKSDELELHKALVLTIGRPASTSKTLEGYVTFQRVGNHKEYVFVEAKAGRRARTGKYAIQSEISWEVLGEAYGICLLDVSIWKFARHFPRVALSHLLSPILGDSMYMNRLVELEGRPTLIDPSQLYKQKNSMWIPPEFLKFTGITQPTIHRLPMMWHVYRTMFPNFGSKNEQMDLVASLDPPSYFVAMVEALGLSTHLARHLQKYER